MRMEGAGLIHRGGAADREVQQRHHPELPQERSAGELYAITRTTSGTRFRTPSPSRKAAPGPCAHPPGSAARRGPRCRRRQIGAQPRRTRRQFDRHGVHLAWRRPAIAGPDCRRHLNRNARCAADHGGTSARGADHRSGYCRSTHRPCSQGPIATSIGRPRPGPPAPASLRPVALVFGQPATAVPSRCQAYTLPSQHPATTSRSPSPSRSPRRASCRCIPPGRPCSAASPRRLCRRRARRTPCRHRTPPLPPGCRPHPGPPAPVS